MLLPLEELLDPLEPEPEPPNVPPVEVAEDPDAVPEAVWLMVLLIVELLALVGF